MPINSFLVNIETAGNWVDNIILIFRGDRRFGSFIKNEPKRRSPRISKTHIGSLETNIELPHLNSNSSHQHTRIEAMANTRTKFIIKD